MPYTRYGEINKGEQPYYEQPVFNFYQGHFQVGLDGAWLWHASPASLPAPMQLPAAFQSPLPSCTPSPPQISVNDLVAGQSQKLPGIPRLSDKQIEVGVGWGGVRRGCCCSGWVVAGCNLLPSGLSSAP